MAGIRVACRGCGKRLNIAKVEPGEDDTIPWHIELPVDHYVTAWPHAPGDMLFFRCQTGDGYAVETPKMESDNVPGAVAQTTWLDYYNRQIREYYDFDTEWALIKEICPEVEKATPAPKRRVIDRSALAVAIMWLALSTAFFSTGFHVGAWLFLMAALLRAPSVICKP